MFSFDDFSIFYIYITIDDDYLVANLFLFSSPFLIELDKMW